MIATVDTLYSDALALSDESRLQLVERLIPTIASEASLDEEQFAEVKGRMEDIRAGRVKTIPGEQVFLEVAQSLAARRSA
ncbi:MAG: addiction module protein [Verrucomicrobiaceae bacterium]|nr:addiction module protein [Verrucomicrobiaceae bacterium]